MINVFLIVFTTVLGIVVRDEVALKSPECLAGEPAHDQTSEAVRVVPPVDADHPRHKLTQFRFIEHLHTKPIVDDTISSQVPSFTSSFANVSGIPRVEEGAKFEGMDIGEPLGQGCFGETWYAKDLNGRGVAIKFFVECKGARKPTGECHIESSYYYDWESMPARDYSNTDPQYAWNVVQDAEAECEMAQAIFDGIGDEAGPQHVMRCLENNARPASSGTIFLVLEFAGRINLGQYVHSKRGSLKLADVLDIERQLFDGVAFLSERGFVHHDLKPPNIAVDTGGTGASGMMLRIIDFGLMRSLKELEDPEAVAGGPPAFFPPEMLAYNGLRTGCGAAKPAWSFDFYMGIATMMTVVAPVHLDNAGVTVVTGRPDLVPTFIPATFIARIQGKTALESFHVHNPDAVRNLPALVDRCTKELHSVCVLSGSASSATKAADAAALSAWWAGQPATADVATADAQKPPRSAYTDLENQLAPAGSSMQMFCGECHGEGTPIAKCRSICLNGEPDVPLDSPFTKKAQASYHATGLESAQQHSRIERATTFADFRELFCIQGNCQITVHEDGMKLFDEYIGHVWNTGRADIIRAALSSDPELRLPPREYLKLLEEGMGVKDPRGTELSCEATPNKTVWHGGTGCTKSFCVCPHGVNDRIMSIAIGVSGSYGSALHGGIIIILLGLFSY